MIEKTEDTTTKVCNAVSLGSVCLLSMYLTGSYIIIYNNPNHYKPNIMGIINLWKFEWMVTRR